MKLLKNPTLLLVIIVVVAAILRLWQLGSVPLSPDWDEASLGYNAYSILMTGKDEYGESFPVVLKSFGDYKPALYTYLIIPLIPVFDLSLISVRLPSVIAGLIAILAMYFLTKELLVNPKSEIRNPKQIQNTNDQNEKSLENGKWKMAIPIIAALLLAISPWHIQLSRVGFEANVGLTCILLMVLFFLKGLQNGKWLVASAVIAALSLYTYQSEKIFVPLLLLALVIIYRKELLGLSRKLLISAIVIGALLSLPLSFYMVTHPESIARAKMTSIISRGDSILERSAKRVVIDKKRGDIVGQIFNNRRVVFAKTIINGYIAHFDPNWLFITGDMPRHHAPGMGLLYIWELPFLIIGFIGLLYLKNKKSVAVILSWLFLAPVPAAFTFDVPHAVRTMQMLPVPVMLSAVGFFSFIVWASNIKYQIAKIQIKYLIFALCFLFFIFNFLYYLNQYFVQQNYFYAKDWQYGYKEAISEVQKQKGKYDKVIVSSQVPLDQSYIFFLYYLKYPPEKYQKEAVYYDGQVDHAFDGYQFRPISWEIDKNKKETLFVGSPKDFQGGNVIKTITYPNGEEAIKLVTP